MAGAPLPGTPGPLTRGTARPRVPGALVGGHVPPTRLTVVGSGEASGGAVHACRFGRQCSVAGGGVGITSRLPQSTGRGKVRAPIRQRERGCLATVPGAEGSRAASLKRSENGQNSHRTRDPAGVRADTAHARAAPAAPRPADRGPDAGRRGRRGPRPPEVARRAHSRSQASSEWSRVWRGNRNRRTKQTPLVREAARCPRGFAAFWGGSRIPHRCVPTTGGASQR